jgi:hypothetical protein
MNSTARTGFFAPETTDTTGLVKRKLHSGKPRFGIMAPAATEGTAFKKNDCPDTLAVIHAAPFDVKH